MVRCLPSAVTTNETAITTDSVFLSWQLKHKESHCNQWCAFLHQWTILGTIKNEEVQFFLKNAKKSSASIKPCPQYSEFLWDMVLASLLRGRPGGNFEAVRYKGRRLAFVSNPWNVSVSSASQMFYHSTICPTYPLFQGTGPPIQNSSSLRTHEWSEGAHKQGLWWTWDQPSGGNKS